MFAIGVMVLTGWAAGIEMLRSITPHFIPMLPLTAVGFVTAGASLFLANSGSARRQAIARTLATFVLILGAWTSVERLMGLDFGVDAILFHKSLFIYPYRPLGLMAVNSAISFLLAGISLNFVMSSRAGFRMAARRLAMLGLAIASVALVGHMYSAPRMFTFDRTAAMALITAIDFAILHAGIMFTHPDEGGVALLTGEDMTGKLMRRSLPAIIGLPLILGFLWIRGREAQLFSRETSVALFVTLVVGAFAYLLWQAGAELHEGERERDRLLEREINARAKADIANRAKNDFLAVVSHELRTPLNAIIGYQALMRDAIAGPITEQQIVFLDRIKRSALHQSEVVGQILTLSQMDAGTVSPVLEKVAMDEALDDMHAIIAPLATAKGLRFTIHREQGLQLWSDRAKLVQILVNLAGNAVKFTSIGEVEVSVIPDGSRVRIDVTDTGIGIAPENQSRVFDDFWQVEAPTTRQFGGAGLGLAVSRKLALLLGGELTLRSEPGKGSTFTLLLENNPPTSVEYRAQTVGVRNP